MASFDWVTTSTKMTETMETESVGDVPQHQEQRRSGADVKGAMRERIAGLYWFQFLQKNRDRPTMRLPMA